MLQVLRRAAVLSTTAAATARAPIAGAARVISTSSFSFQSAGLLFFLCYFYVFVPNPSLSSFIVTVPPTSQLTKPVNPQDPLQRPLYYVLLRLPFAEFTNTELLKYLKDNKLPGLADHAEKMEMNGDYFIAELPELTKLHKTEMENLANLVESKMSTGLQNEAKKVRTFGMNGAVPPDGDHFYVIRSSTFELLDTFSENPRFYLVYGPRRSGKSTLMHRIINNIDTSRFVYAKVQLPNETSPSQLWGYFCKHLAEADSVASPEVREAAKRYLVDLANNSPVLPFLEHLFRYNYGGKKLILFWDEFDNAYKPERREPISTGLRLISDFVKESSLPQFGGVVCFGTYNANLVAAAGVSVFVPDAKYSHETLDFSLDEAESLFEQFENTSKCKVDPEVVKSVHQLASGHTGLVNVCGRFMQDQGGDWDLGRWQSSMPKLVSFIAKQPVYDVLTTSLVDDVKLIELLRRLCLTEGEAFDSRRDSRHKDAQQHGLAKVTSTSRTSIFLMPL
jgi:hypothetical protein